MKVAILLNGLPHRVEEGYDNFWKNVIEKYNADVYLHYWTSGPSAKGEQVNKESVDKVLNIYNPIDYAKLEPINFEKYTYGISTLDRRKVNYSKEFGVTNGHKGFVQIYTWDVVYKLLKKSEKRYDVVIRSRYDISVHNKDLDLDKYDPEKYSIAHAPWANTWGGAEPIPDDNILITGQDKADILLNNIFDFFVSMVNENKMIWNMEKNFRDILVKKNLFQYVERHKTLNFKILRG